MSPKVRDGLYLALAVLNACLLGMTQQGVVPAQYGQYVAVASYACASLMQRFGETK